MEIDQKDSSFAETIIKSAEKYASTLVSTIDSMFGLKLTSSASELVEHRLVTDKNFYVSILFTGLVYGEYILAMDENTAAKTIGLDMTGKTDAEKAKIREDITETFCEVLNIVVGESVVNLNQVYKKLTITPPRVYFGSVTYPKVKMAKTTLNSEQGSFESFVFIDRMKLDIAASYKEALVSVLNAHKELQNAMKKLQDQQSLLVQSEKMAALGTMAAGVAHEINTPLSTVSMVGGQIKDIIEAVTEVDRKAVLEMLNTIENTIARIAKITNGMRTFAHQARSDKPMSIQASKIVENAMVFFENTLGEKGIKFQPVFPADEPIVECRITEISQVLINLVNNSCSAIESLPTKWIRLEVKNLDQVVEFRVTDSGLGISAEVEKKMFDPFFTTKDFGQGVGLGLSISKGIVDQHGGKIGVDRTSLNTCFYIHIPKKFVAVKAS